MCCKTIFTTRMSNIDSRMSTSAQRRFKNTVQLYSIIARSERSKEFCNTFWGRAEVRDAREATTAIGANAKTLVFASTTNTDHAPEGLSGSLRRTATTLRGDTVQRL